jgi:hypothetical protein
VHRAALLLVALGLLIAFLVALGITHLVRDDWTETRWTAVAALATVVQAVGVFAALIYAKRQIDSSKRQRRDQLLDRLEAVVYDDLLPAATALLGAWDRLLTDLHLAHEQFGTDEQRDALLRRWYAESNERVNASQASIEAAANRVLRTARLMGMPTPGVVISVRFHAATLWTADLPSFGEPVEPVHEKEAEVKELQAAIVRLKDWLNGYIAAHVASG